MAEFPIVGEDAYTEIKALIKEKGLETITSKMIRKHLEAKFNYNLEESKAELDAIIERCIDETMKEEEEEPDSSDEDATKDGKPEVNKEAKKPKTTAAKLESHQKTEEDNFSQPPSVASRASNSKSKRCSSNDEEHEDMATAIKRRRCVTAKYPERKEKRKEKNPRKTRAKANTMFTKICVLSPELANLIGKRYLRRSDVVKAMWAYFRAHNLQDPKNRQFYFLDEPLKRIFGNKARMKPFGMMGTLKNHVKDIVYLDDETRRIAEIEIAQMLEDEEKAALKGGNGNGTAEYPAKQEPPDEEEEDDEEEDDDLAGGDMKIEGGGDTNENSNASSAASSSNNIRQEMAQVQVKTEIKSEVTEEAFVADGDDADEQQEQQPSTSAYMLEEEVMQKTTTTQQTMVMEKTIKEEEMDEDDENQSESGSSESAEEDANETSSESEDSSASD